MLGRVPGGGRSGRNPLLAVSIKEELGYCCYLTEGKGLIFNFVLYNTQLQGFVPEKESPSNQRIHFQLGCFLSNPLCCQTLKKCATFNIIILPLQF